MEIEKSVAQHYTHGALEAAILEGLRKAGLNPDALSPADLAPVDEFHIGGRQATAELAAQMEIKRGDELLDIGSGLGGASRYFAQEYGCRVTGIDLTREYVATAQALARRVGMDGRVSYRQGSALALPFEPATFDGAYMIHVGMNIENKAGLFAGIRRVLKPGAVFGIFDIMREKDGELMFPVPWAANAVTSFVESPAAYLRMLEQAGFAIVKHRSRRQFAIEFFAQMRARTAQAGGPPALGYHILMGASAQPKLANTVENIERGLIAPVEIIARAV